MFQAVKYLSAHPSYLRLGLFCKLFGDFWVYLGKVVFLKGLVKLMGLRNLEDLMLFYTVKLYNNITLPH